MREKAHTGGTCSFYTKKSQLTWRLVRWPLDHCVTLWFIFIDVTLLQKSTIIIKVSQKTKNECSCEPLLCTWIISTGRKQNIDNWCKTCSLYLKWLWPNPWLLVDFLHQNDPGQWSLVSSMGCCVCFFPQLFSQLGTVEFACSFASKLTINVTTLKHHHQLIKWGK